MIATRGRPAVFLDRDGVLNEALVRGGVPTPPRSLEEFRVLPGVARACADLKRAGFVLVVVTNQPDVARGMLTAAEVDGMHERLRSLVRVDEIRVCMHDDSDACGCRKPQPGMLLDAADRLSLDLGRSASVGDRWRDVEAAQRAGVRAIYVERHYDEPARSVRTWPSQTWPRPQHGSGGKNGRRRATGMTDLRLKTVKIFADGADLPSLLALADQPHIAGFTTNPTLMRQCGVSDYEGFARKLLEHITGRPISFEVFADDHDEMLRQARLIASWGSNVYVKIPVTDTRGQSTAAVVRELTDSGVQVNVTALMTLSQVEAVTSTLAGGSPAVISVFAGRVADTGRDPLPLMRAALEAIAPYPELELLWASPREILNVRQADDLGVHIITVTHDLLKKLALLGRDLDAFSLETVRMFHDDAATAGYLL